MICVLQVAETNSEEVEGHMRPYVLLLHAFCLVDPTLCAPASDPSQFVITLQPYLKSQVKSVYFWYNCCFLKWEIVYESLILSLSDLFSSPYSLTIEWLHRCWKAYCL